MQFHNSQKLRTLYFDNGYPRFLFVLLMILASGVDIRTKEIGLPGSVNMLEVLGISGVLLLLVDSVIYPKQISNAVKQSWQISPMVCMYAFWTFFSGFIGIIKLPLSFFIFRNLFPVFIFFLLVSVSVDSVKNVKLLILVFILSTFPNVFLSFSQLLFHWPYPIALNLATAVKMDVDGSFVKNVVSGLFNHPNGLSIYLMPPFLLLLGLTIFPVFQNRYLRFLFGCLAILIGVLLFYTKAKGSWMWACFGLLLLLIPKKLITLRNATWIYMTVLVVTIFIVTIISLNLGGALKTMITRLHLWESSWVVLTNDFFVALFGSGQIDVWNVSARLSDLQYSNAHNVFINQAIYFGLPGAVLYLSLITLGVRSSLLVARTSLNQDCYYISKICFATILSISGQYFFEPSAESSGLALELLFFILIPGLFLKIRKNEERKTNY